MIGARLKRIAKRALGMNTPSDLQPEPVPQPTEEQIRRAKRERLVHLPRYTRCTTDFFGPDMVLTDAPGFTSMYDEIFDREIYKFRSTTQSPLILDCGANIGVSVLYFKRLYPGSKVVAFEPDPLNFDALQSNVRSFGLDRVDLVNKAVWSSEPTLDFMTEGADAGRMVELDPSFASTRVGTVRLRDYLEEQVEFLKLDIEGAETEVLLDCADRLHNVGNLFVEYHSFEARPQTLAELLTAIAGSGFRVYVRPNLNDLSACPLIERHSALGMDLQLNVFGYRK